MSDAKPGEAQLAKSFWPNATAVAIIPKTAKPANNRVAMKSPPITIRRYIE